MKKIGRNAPCPCGSGLKYKRCCEGKDITAALDEALGSLDPQEEAEIHLLDHVYRSILMGVWCAFHGPTESLPEVEGLEEFYREIYGYDFDPGLVNEIIYPLSPLALAQLQSHLARAGDKVIEIAPTARQTELPLAPEAFPDSR